VPIPLQFSSRAPALRYALTALPASSHMDIRDPHYVSGSESDADYGHGHRPSKRPRHTPPSDRARTNGRNAPSSSSPSSSSSALPPLSLSILGIEPIDEFIREVADFVHHTITTRPAELQGEIEVEAKIGILRDRGTGNRLQLPVLVETSAIIVARHLDEIYLFLPVLAPKTSECHFESNMSQVSRDRLSALQRLGLHPSHRPSINISTFFLIGSKRHQTSRDIARRPSHTLIHTLSIHFTHPRILGIKRKFA